MRNGGLVDDKDVGVVGVVAQFHEIRIILNTDQSDAARRFHLAQVRGGSGQIVALNGQPRVENQRINPVGLHRKNLL